MVLASCELVMTVRTFAWYCRAYINTYISLLSATVCTFIASTIFGPGRRFQAVDVQNATLAGRLSW